MYLCGEKNTVFICGQNVMAKSIITLEITIIT